MDRLQFERILEHIREATRPPMVLPARSPPQFATGIDQTIATNDWLEVGQTAGQGMAAGSDPLPGEWGARRS